MNSSDSSEEENCDFQQWNNWEPAFSSSSSTAKTGGNRVLFNRIKDETCWESMGLLETDRKFGNWIPPVNFITERKKTPRLIKLALKRAQEKKESDDSRIIDCWKTDPFNDSKVFDKIKVDLSESKLLESSLTQELDGSLQKRNVAGCIYTEKWEKVLNADWGNRVELHDITSFSDGDTIWGHVNLGIFRSIKLWMNEYSNICGYAEGTITKKGNSELTLITITDCKNLRKMLQLRHSQWTALTEYIQRNKVTLKFDTKSDVNLSKLTALEKIWVYICKRRHCSQYQSMLVKVSGAVKSLQDFNIIPKVVVQDIRNLTGQELL